MRSELIRRRAAVISLKARALNDRYRYVVKNASGLIALCEGHFDDPEIFHFLPDAVGLD